MQMWEEGSLHGNPLGKAGKWDWELSEWREHSMEVLAAELALQIFYRLGKVGRTGCDLPFSTELRRLQKVAAPA